MNQEYASFKTFLLNEAIDLPVRKFWVFYPKRLKQIETLVHQLRKNVNIINKLEDHWHDEFKWHVDRADISYSIDPEYIRYMLQEIIGKSDTDITNGPLHKGLYWIDSVLGQGKVSHSEIERIADQAARKLERIEEQGKIWDELEGYFGSVEWKYHLKSWSNDHKLDGDDLKIYNALQGIIKTRKKVSPLLRNIVVASRAKAKEMTYEHHHTDMPHTEKVEKMYHASFNAGQLYKKGFETNYDFEKSGGGLGYLGGFKKGLISFTYDLTIAQDIASAYKDLWKIANGKLTAKTIVKWMKKQKVEDDVKTNYNQYSNKWDYDRDVADPTPYTIINIYELYLWFSKTRVNPNFGSSFKYRKDFVGQMKKTKFQDIGIIEVMVDVSGDHVTYHAGEREYRVAPSDVVEMKKFIK